MKATIDSVRTPERYRTIVGMSMTGEVRGQVVRALRKIGVPTFRCRRGGLIVQLGDDLVRVVELG